MRQLEAHEEGYLLGYRAALTAQLNDILAKMGYDGSRTLADFISEREEAISRLRDACEEHGDNDWDENLHLADIIEKHLIRHL